MAIPLRRGIGVNLGFRDLTVGSYAYSARINQGQEDEYLRRIEGSGGLGQFQMGVTARALQSRLGVGLQYGVVGGTVRDLIEDDFSSGDFQDTRNLLRTRMEGGRPVSFGLQARPVDPFEIGATYTAASSLDLRSLFENRTGNREESRARMDLPASIGVGATVRATPQWLVSADFTTRAWSEHAFETIDSLGVALGRDFAGLDDARRFGVGFTRLPGEHTPKDPLFQRAVYRAGFTHAVLPSRQSNGSEVKEWALTAGIGLPVQVDRGYIDGLVEFGKRGDADTDLSETFLRLGFSVTFGKLEDAF
ncbi:MAG: hypothetical protein IPK72_15120 [Candidatus Eisenbacteria bacterium]|nr:hypothetical protein [Candidatus Eisenbacteria bacterium]